MSFQTQSVKVRNTMEYIFEGSNKAKNRNEMAHQDYSKTFEIKILAPNELLHILQNSSMKPNVNK